MSAALALSRQVIESQKKVAVESRKLNEALRAIIAKQEQQIALQGQIIALHEGRKQEVDKALMLLSLARVTPQI